MRFIDAHDFPVGLVLRVLDIASSTYYDWRARATLPARRRREDAELLALIDEVRASHEFASTYGSPAGVARAAPPRGAGEPQTCRADHAGERSARRLPIVPRGVVDFGSAHGTHGDQRVVLDTMLFHPIRSTTTPVR